MSQGQGQLTLLSTQNHVTSEPIAIETSYRKQVARPIGSWVNGFEFHTYVII